MSSVERHQDHDPYHRNQQDDQGGVEARWSGVSREEGKTTTILDVGHLIQAKTKTPGIERPRGD